MIHFLIIFNYFLRKIGHSYIEIDNLIIDNIIITFITLYIVSSWKQSMDSFIYTLFHPFEYFFHTLKMNFSTIVLKIITYVGMYFKFSWHLNYNRWHMNFTLSAHINHLFFELWITYEFSNICLLEAHSYFQIIKNIHYN